MIKLPEYEPCEVCKRVLVKLVYERYQHRPLCVSCRARVTRSLDLIRQGRLKREKTYTKTQMDYAIAITHEKVDREYHLERKRWGFE